MEKLGIEKLKVLLALPLSIHMAYEKAKLDGEINAADAGYAVDPMMKLMPAIASAKEAIPELKDLDPVEKAELMELIKADYDLADDILEAKVEQAFNVVLSIAVLVGIM